MGKMNNRKWTEINNVIYCSHFVARFCDVTVVMVVTCIVLLTGTRVRIMSGNLVIIMNAGVVEWTRVVENGNELLIVTVVWLLVIEGCDV
jgi:hypothetical protein